MKQILDFLPLVIFFIFFKMQQQIVHFGGLDIPIGGIYSATMFLVVSTILIYGFQILKYKKLDKNQIITLVAVLLFGGMTLGFHSDSFIKWKAPVVNWVFGIAFIFSSVVLKKPLIKKLLGHAMQLPETTWQWLNTSWGIFFLVLGTANLYVAFTFEKYWVDFKVFGSLGLTLLFMILQFVFIAKHIRPSAEEKTKEQ